MGRDIAWAATGIHYERRRFTGNASQKLKSRSKTDELRSEGIGSDPSSWLETLDRIPRQQFDRASHFDEINACGAAHGSMAIPGVYAF
jgi:hypothetical protein